MADALGCGTHTVQVVDRSGAQLGTLDGITSLQWERRRNVTSQAAVSLAVSSVDDACCKVLSDVRTWRHELRFLRDGKAVWRGPITHIQLNADGTASLTAQDHSIWLSRRVLHTDLAFTSTDLSDVAAAMLSAVFDPDDIGVLDLLYATDTGILVDIEFAAEQGTAAELLDQLAQLGLSWTMVLGRLFLSGRDCTGYIGSWSDSNFPAGVSIIESGLDAINKATVVGATVDDGDADTEDPSALGIRTGRNSDYYGILERLVRDSDITSDAQAAELAQSLVDAADVGPVVIQIPQESWIDPGTIVDVDHLLPGICIDMRSSATCRTVAQRLQLQALVVSDSAGQGEGEIERVSGTFGPPGVDVSRVVL